jgi:hypothetical protein
MKRIAISLILASAALAADPEAKATTIGPWARIDQTSPMDGTTHVTLKAKASDGSNGEQLIIRFTGKKLEIFFSTDGTIDLRHGLLDVYNFQWVAVRIKLDNAVPLKQTWRISDDHMAMFSLRPDKLLSQLKTGSKLYVEYSPYTQTPRTVSFEIDHLSEALSQSK